MPRRLVVELQGVDCALALISADALHYVASIMEPLADGKQITAPVTLYGFS